MTARGYIKSEHLREVERERRAANRAFLDELKSAPCLDCGGTFDPVCMDFDHRPDEVKVNEVGRLISCSRERLLEEIAKCDLVCANCHRLRTKRRAIAATRVERWPATRIEFRPGGRIVQVGFPEDPEDW